MFESPYLVSRLAKVTHFRVLPPTAIHEIVTSGRIQTLAAGTLLFHEGWEYAGLFVLFRGRVHLCKTSFQGQDSIISVIEPIIMFN